MTLSVVYLTNRLEPRLGWFLESLRNQERAGEIAQVIVVDFHAETPGRRAEFAELAQRPLAHVEPKPNVFSGPHRLPKDNWFSAANSRNTGLCYCASDWVAYVDDLSVLLPGWLQCVREAMAGGYVALGSYRKVRKLVVQNGNVIAFEEPSDDTRLKQVTQEVTRCDGGWLYGCSLAGPVEAFLKVGGWPEDLCDGLGSEDCCMGKVLMNAGVDLRYCRKMMTLESEEDHNQPGGFKKADKGPAGTESDKSHRALRTAERSRSFKNSCDVRAARQRVLAGQGFEPPKGPLYDWFDGQRIAEMT